MFKYRPIRGSLDEAMREEQTFDTMDQMFDYISKDPMIDKEDLLISENLGKDDRIDWLETRHILVKKYGSNVFDTPQCIGYCSMEEYNHLPFLTASKNICISGISRHHLLKMLYDAAKPYNKTITLEEAAEALHNTIDMVTELKGKKLYVNVFGDTFDGSKYDSYNGIGLSYHIVCQMIHHLLFGDSFDLFEYHRRVAGPGLGLVSDDTKRLFQVECRYGMSFDCVIVKARTTSEAWDTFWNHFDENCNLDHDDIGYENQYPLFDRKNDTYTYQNIKMKNVSIKITPLNMDSDFVYVCGGYEYN